jgi:hypothetical protein
MELQGFRKATHTNLPLLARQTVRVDGSLAIGTQAQAVEVSTAREAPISTEVSNIAETKLGREADRPSGRHCITGRGLDQRDHDAQAGVEIDNNRNLSEREASRACFR